MSILFFIGLYFLLEDRPILGLILMMIGCSGR